MRSSIACRKASLGTMDLACLQVTLHSPCAILWFLVGFQLPRVVSLQIPSNPTVCSGS